MRAACCIVLCLSSLSACGGGGACEGDECIGAPCGPSNECPANLICDPVSMTCIRRGGGADAGPQPDAPPAKGPLTLTVYVAGVPTAFADVVIGNADGTMATNGQTNTSGVYQFADFEPGMMVSVVNTAMATPILYVLQDLSPGNIVLGDPLLDTARNPITASAVAFDNSPTYEAANGCARPDASGALKWTLAVSDGCIDAQNQIRLVVYARDAVGQRSAYAVLDSPYPPAGNLDIASWKTDLGSVVITPSNVPATGTVTMRLTGTRSATPRAAYASDTVTLTGPTVQTLRFAPGAYDTVATTVTHSETSDGFLKGRLLIHGHPVTSGSSNIQEAVDLATDFLALPSNPVLDRTDETRPFVTLGAPAPTFDATLALVSGSRGTDPVTPYIIFFVAPPGKTSIKLPELPASLAVVTPIASDELRLFVVELVDIDVVGGYRAFLDIPNFIGFTGGQPPGVAGEFKTRVSLTAPSLR